MSNILIESPTPRLPMTAAEALDAAGDADEFGRVLGLIFDGLSPRETEDLE